MDVTEVRGPREIFRSGISVRFTGRGITGYADTQEECKKHDHDDGICLHDITSSINSVHAGNTRIIPRWFHHIALSFVHAIIGMQRWRFGRNCREGIPPLWCGLRDTVGFFGVHEEDNASVRAGFSREQMIIPGK